MLIAFTGLLLCWYFVYKHLNCISSNPNSRLTTLLDEVFSELRLADNMTINDIATLPLATCAQLIGEKSVWQGQYGQLIPLYVSHVSVNRAVHCRK